MTSQPPPSPPAPPRKPRWRRRLLLAALGLALALVLLLAGALLGTQTAAFRDLLRGVLVSQAGNYLEGSLALRSIEGNFYSRLSLVGLELRDGDGNLVLSLARLDVGLDPWKLLERHLHIQEVRLVEPQVWLREDERGLNVARLVPPGDALTPQPPLPLGEGEKQRNDGYLEAPLPSGEGRAGGGGEGMRITLDRLAIEGGALSYRQAGEQGPRTVADLNGLWLAVAGSYLPQDGKPACRLHLEELRLTPRIPRLPEVALSVEGSYLGGELALPSLTLQAGTSRLELSGTLGPLHEPVPDVTLRVPRLDLTEFAALLPGQPLAEPISLEARVQGVLADLRAAVDLTTGHGRVGLRGWANLADMAQPEYDLNLAWQGVQVAPFLELALAQPPEFPASLTGSLRATGAGAEPLTLRSEARLALRESTVLGRPIQRLDFAARVAEGRASGLGLYFDGPQGRLEVDGNVTFAGALDAALPLAARLRLALDSLDLATLPLPQPARGSVAAQLALTAHKAGGAELLASQASVKGLLSLTGLGGPLLAEVLESPLSKAELGLTASLERGALRVEQAALTLPGLDLALSGTATLKSATLNSAAAGMLVEQLDLAAQLEAEVAKLAALLVPVPAARGSLKLEAGLRGSLDQPEFTASLVGAGLALPDTVAADKLQVEVSGSGRDLETLQAEVTLGVRGLEAAGQSLPTVDLTAKLEPGKLALDFDATEANKRSLGLTATVSPLLAPPWGIDLTRLVAAADKLTLHNEAPARLVVSPQSLQMSRLALSVDGHRIALRGGGRLDGDLNLSLHTDELDLAKLLAFVPGGPPDLAKISGGTRLDLHLTGSTAAPEFALQLGLSRLRFADYPALDSVLAASYRGERLLAELNTRALGQELLWAKVALPLDLAWPLPEQPLPDKPLSGEVALADLNLMLVRPFLPKAAGRVAGVLSASANIAGKLPMPDFNATVRLREAALASESIGYDYRRGRATIRASNRMVRLEELSLTTEVTPRLGLGSLFGKPEPIRGSLTARAVVPLKDFAPGPISAQVSFNRFAPVSSGEHLLVLGGEIGANGTPDRLSIDGNLTVEEARITIPDFGGEKQVEDVTIVEAGQPEVETLQTTSTTTDAFTKNTAVNVSVRIPGKTWLLNPQSNIELGGDIRASKDFGQALALYGEVATRRGYIEQFGKEFTLAAGEVTFTGSTPPDPLLNLKADHAIRDTGQVVVISLLVTGRASAPVISLVSEPDMEDADKVSYLLFGKPQDRLSEGESKAMEDQLMGMLGGQAASMLNRILGKSLAVDMLKVRTGEEGLSDGSLTVGKYLTDRLFMSVTQGFDEKGETTVMLEYSLLEWLKLAVESSTEANTGGDIVIEHRY